MAENSCPFCLSNKIELERAQQVIHNISITNRFLTEQLLSLQDYCRKLNTNNLPTNNKEPKNHVGPRSDSSSSSGSTSETNSDTEETQDAAHTTNPNPNPETPAATPSSTTPRHSLQPSSSPQILPRLPSSPPLFSPPLNQLPAHNNTTTTQHNEFLNTMMKDLATLPPPLSPIAESNGSGVTQYIKNKTKCPQCNKLIRTSNMARHRSNIHGRGVSRSGSGSTLL